MRQQVGTVQPTPGGGLNYPATKTIYDDSGRVLTVDQGTTPSQSRYDFDNNFTSLVQTASAYDAATGAKIRDTFSIGGTAQSVTQYSYDAGGRPTCTARRNNASVFGSLPANACTLSTTGSYGQDQISRNNYDAANRVTSITTGVASGSTLDAVTNNYSSLHPAQIDWIEDGKGNRSSFTYDSFTNRLTQINFPDKTSPHTPSGSDFEQYEYDAQGNLIIQQLRGGGTVALLYDARNRLSVKDVSDSVANDVFYAYDQVDDLLSARSGGPGGSGTLYTWDALGRKLTESDYSVNGPVTRTVTSAYDAAGNRTCLIYPDVGTNAYHIEYTYDVLNRMKRVQEHNSATCGGGTATVMVEYSYDDLGRVASIGRANPSFTSTSYGGSSQSWSLTQSLAGTGQDVTYGMAYTPAGQLSGRTITTSNAGYQFSVSAAATTNYCRNGLNQYAKVENSTGPCSGGQAYSYDNRGNLTSDGTRSFAYDLENKLTQATVGTAGTPTNWNAANWNAFDWSGAAATTFGYDPQGRLRQIDSATGTQQYVYDGDARLVEYDAGGTILRRYVPGAGVDETLVWYEGANLATPRWLHTDQQGSVVAASNSSGVSAATYAYGPYGEPLGGFASGGPVFRYTGQVQLPAVGLYYYKARMYDPVLGRFLQSDPAGYSAGMNLYAYVMNDPANATDPSGMEIVCDKNGQNCIEIVKAQGRRTGSDVGPSYCTNPNDIAYNPNYCDANGDPKAGGQRGGGRDSNSQPPRTPPLSPPPQPQEKDCGSLSSRLFYGYKGVLGFFETTALAGMGVALSGSAVATLAVTCGGPQAIAMCGLGAFAASAMAPGAAASFFLAYKYAPVAAHSLEKAFCRKWE